MQGKHLSVFSYFWGVADIHLEMVLAAGRGGEGPHLAEPSGYRYWGILELLPREKSDVRVRDTCFCPQRHFLGFKVLEQVMWLKDCGSSLGSRRGSGEPLV